MTTSDVATSFEQHQQLLAQTNALNKQAVFDALEAGGITSVTVTFDGEGDSGQIQEVTAFKANDPTPLPATTIRYYRASWNAKEPEPLDSPLEEAIRDLCWDYLSDEHGGWENNDGGFGEFMLHVSKREVELDFNARFSDYTHYSHTF